MTNYFSDAVVNPQLLNNIQTFGELPNIDKVRENITKQLLTLVDVNLSNEGTVNEQTQFSKAEGDPQLTLPKVVTQDSLLQRVKNIQENGVDNTADKLQSNGRSDYKSDAILVLSTLSQVFKDTTIADLNKKVEQFEKESTAIREVGNEMITELEASLDELRQAKTDVTLATANFEKEKSGLESLENKLTIIKEKIADLLDKKNGLPHPPVSAGDIELAALYDSELNVLSKQEQSLFGEIEIKKQDVVDKQNIFEEAVRRSKTSAEIVADKTTKTNMYIDALGKRAQSLDVNEKVKSAMSELTLLSGMLADLIGKMNLDNIKNEQEALEKINETSRKNSEEKAKEMEKSNKKAEDANKAASCASKILSAIMMIISAIMLIASFGMASPLALALGAVALAISVADVALEATGQSTVMQQLAGAISKAIKESLIASGVEKSKADLIANILGMILAAAVFIVISILSLPNIGKNVASAGKNIANMIANMGKTLNKITSNIIPNLFKTVFNDIGNTVSKAATQLLRGLERAQSVIKHSQSFQKVSQAMEMTETVRAKAQSIGSAVDMGLSAANSVIPGSLNFSAAMQRIDMKKAEANLLLAMENTDIINKILASLLETATSMQKNLLDMVDRMFGTVDATVKQKISTMDRAYSATQMYGKSV